MVPKRAIRKKVAVAQAKERERSEDGVMCVRR